MTTARGAAVVGDRKAAIHSQKQQRQELLREGDYGGTEAAVCLCSV